MKKRTFIIKVLRYISIILLLLTILVLVLKLLIITLGFAKKNTSKNTNTTINNKL